MSASSNEMVVKLMRSIGAAAKPVMKAEYTISAGGVAVATAAALLGASNAMPILQNVMLYFALAQSLSELLDFTSELNTNRMLLREKYDREEYEEHVNLDSKYAKKLRK